MRHSPSHRCQRRRNGPRPVCLSSLVVHNITVWRSICTYRTASMSGSSPSDGRLKVLGAAGGSGLARPSPVDLTAAPPVADTQCNDPEGELKTQIEDHILPQLDPDFLRYFISAPVRQQRALLQQPTSSSIGFVRKHPELFRSPCALDSSKYPRVSDFVCPSQDNTEIRVRVYHPDPEAHGSGPYPVHLNFHGKFSHPLSSIFPSCLAKPKDSAYRVLQAGGLFLAIFPRRQHSV